MPKLITARLLEIALTLPEPVQITCTEDKSDRLIAELAVHRIDLVISDAPLPPHASFRAYNHPLGETPVSFFAARELAARLGRRFPRSTEETAIASQRRPPWDRVSLEDVAF